MDNHTTLHPEITAIEVLKVTTEEDGTLYAVQLALILDIQEYKVSYLPTEILEETVDAAIRKSLASVAKLFAPISAIVPVIDISSGKLVETININDRAYKSDEADEVKVPEGVTLH